MNKCLHAKKWEPALTRLQNVYLHQNRMNKHPSKIEGKVRRIITGIGHVGHTLAAVGTLVERQAGASGAKRDQLPQKGGEKR